MGQKSRIGEITPPTPESTQQIVLSPAVSEALQGNHTLAPAYLLLGQSVAMAVMNVKKSLGEGKKERCVLNT